MESGISAAGDTARRARRSVGHPAMIRVTQKPNTESADSYDLVYKRMISKLDFSDFSSSISMEEMKFTTAVPTKYI